MEWQYERTSYRIPYPANAQATATINATVVRLMDCSDRGLRYVAEAAIPASGSRITATVRLLSDDEEHEVEGVVVRTVGTEVAVALDAPGIPTRAIYAEQRWLAQRFPARFRPLDQG
jgi:hypothetical protein